MPELGPAAIKRHWIVSAFTPAEAGEDGLGTLAAFGSNVSWEVDVFATLEEAKTKARELASVNPGQYYVVYEAEWYAWTDITPVNIRRVGEASIA